MLALEEKILKEGKVLPGNILKVGSFLNHQIDVDFIMETGREISRLFADEKITKILTIETSGIPIAFAAGAAISFFTGTSWGTYALLVPFAIPIAFGLSGG